jgi:FAD/FMN-containing dehydrogenase
MMLPAGPGTPLTLARLAGLRDHVRGSVVLPDDPGWDDRRRPWSLAVDQRPVAVVDVTDADDVAAAVRFARDAGAPVTAQVTGHGATRAVDGAVLIRTGALDAVSVDRSAAVARVGAGVRWARLMSELDGTGFTGVAGSNPNVGVVGYLLGGGLSWFSRRYGFAARGLRAVELVGADGTPRRVTAESDADLMWALRGGGGDFGIVTAVEIDLVPAPDIYGGKLMFPIADASTVLPAVLDVTARAPRELTVWTSLARFPDLPQLPPHLRGQAFVTVDATFLGDAQSAGPWFAAIREAGSALQDTAGPVTPGTLGDVAAEPGVPTASLITSFLVSGLDAATLDTLTAVSAEAAADGVAIVQVRHLGGALAEDHPAAGVAGSVPEPFIVSAIGPLMSPESGGPLQAGLQRVRESLAAVAADRSVLNFLPPGEGIGRAYDPERVERLREIKRRVDPDGVIRGNRPVLDGPAGSPVA